MKKLIFIAFSLSLVIISCDTSGVKKEKAEPTEKADKKQTYERSDLDQQHAVADEKKMENGIIIRWFEHGSGETVKDGELIEIDYKVLLKDRTVVDGNHLLNKESMPFMVGFNMQTKGWDIALRQL